jgi:hypothetical protein
MDLNLNILKGFVVRLVLTLGTFIILPYLKLDKYYFIILPIVLTLLDFTDNIFTNLAKPFQSVANSTFYHLQDKIIDALSYIFVWYVFKLDNKFLYLVLYRLIGVYWYYHTDNKKIFTLFPDLFKEFLFIHGIFEFNKYIPYVIVLIIKIIFEYLFHK